MEQKENGLANAIMSGVGSLIVVVIYVFTLCLLRSSLLRSKLYYFYVYMPCWITPRALKH